MTALAAIQLALTFLSSVLTQFNQIPGLDTTIAAVEAAISALSGVASNPTSKAQLEGLRLKVLW